MPENVRYKILAAVTLPVLSVFPICSLLLGMILCRQRERRVAEVALEEHRHLLDRERGLLRSLLNAIPDLIFVKNTAGEYVECNKAFAQQLGVSEKDVIGKTDQDFFSEEVVEKLRQEEQEILSSGKPVDKEERVQFPGQRERFMSTHKAVFRGLNGTLYGVAGIARDITETKRAEQERELLQAQLAQAQKIESVGQLAGGIAHDFNNMLAIILGQADLAELKLGNQERVAKAIAEIKNAAKRSSDLTQQLLAFARKQAIVPKVMDLNARVSGMVKMLRRVIGEDIDLKLVLGPDLWKVKMDSGQVDQILTNLCVNARDAIDGHGQIIIETQNVLLDEAWCAAHGQLPPGEYVAISVSDDGRGIDRETIEQIFEPFFTTKRQGEGTGLGLATVYGIVTQNQGYIDVVSRPGQGSIFKIYLPRTKESEDGRGSALEKRLSHGQGTILLVEDEQAVLSLTEEMLKELGYKVLSASSPKQVLELAANYSEPIHLLLTDVVMPESNGLALSKQLLKYRSEMKVLFMSGYTANVIAQHGILEEGVDLIEKPFTLQALSEKVRQVMG
ncbi:hybrid sensor histidine kinase/response regulator [Malonomonas rubra]|nr:PAS domain-containing sensor histidine kinase [Malonomonas rubra]